MSFWTSFYSSRKSYAKMTPAERAQRIEEDRRIQFYLMEKAAQIKPAKEDR